MSRFCPITGKATMSGNNVSHAVNRTRRRFYPNLQRVSLLSSTLNEKIRLQITTAGLRTIDKHGGLDGFLLSRAPSKIPDPDLRRLRRRILAITGPQAFTPAKTRKKGPSRRLIKKTEARKAATAQPSA